MSQGTLYDKLFDLHTVARLENGDYQLFAGLHLIHDVTSSPAFQMLRDIKGKVLRPDLTYATADHTIPTDSLARPFKVAADEALMSELERNARENGIEFFGQESGNQGIVHVIGPELGLTQPGKTIACGDSHTSTHGAFGAMAFGIGTTDVLYLLMTQSIPTSRLKVRKIEVYGDLEKGVYAKDVILYIIRKLGVNSGKGYAYEYAGKCIDDMDMEARMTVCNMSIEGNALVGYVNPDQKTFDYLKGRKYAPQGEEFKKAVNFWNSIRSGSQAKWDDAVTFNAKQLEPMVTWGINPGQAIGVTERMPELSEIADRETAEKAYTHMGFEPGDYIAGKPIDVAFIGSCTNSRISDLREAAGILNGRNVSVRTLVVPGSYAVKYQAEQEGLHSIFEQAGAEWRGAGCSMCLGMNPDKLKGSQISASSSNRNFIGRQGSEQGRTLLMSPAMVAAAAVAGRIVDVREYLR